MTDEPAVAEPVEEEDELVAGGRVRPILATMRSLGPCTAREIAERLDREPANVSTQLRGYEERGEVRRTGRSVNEAGGRGGPRIEWELVPANGHTTDPTMPMQAPPAALGVERERVRHLTERVERLSADVERLEDELERERGRANALESEGGGIRRPVVSQGDVEMRRAYFELLLGLAGKDDVDEHVFDRIERLIGLGEVDAPAGE